VLAWRFTKKQWSTIMVEIEVSLIDERNDKVSPLGVKGLGEIRIVGTAGAIGNAISMRWERSGFPITLGKLLSE
jgi:xanthine dehydrogenase YagR molybdenum-binding subunit